jgi:hypothetical protein
MFTNNDHNLQIVISRYNESLEWLRENIFQGYSVIIYNKGINDDFYKPPNCIIYRIPNVGRESHTYLYHIIHNYHSLSENTMFLPGSTNIPHKMVIAKKWLKEYIYNSSPFFLGHIANDNDVKYHMNDFEINKYSSSYIQNKIKEEPMMLSENRPYGKWFETHFGELKVKYYNYCGILIINKKQIIEHNIFWYEKIINDLKNHSNPEVGHYVERSWCAIFYPSNNIRFKKIEDV